MLLGIYSRLQEIIIVCSKLRLKIQCYLNSKLLLIAEVTQNSIYLQFESKIRLPQIVSFLYLPQPLNRRPNKHCDVHGLQYPQASFLFLNYSYDFRLFVYFHSYPISSIKNLDDLSFLLSFLFSILTCC